MSIMLGNLTASDLQGRLGITFLQDDMDFLNATHQSSATNIADDKWHCFDIPFVIVAGSYSTAEKVYEILKKHSSQIMEPLNISIVDKKG